MIDALAADIQAARGALGHWLAVKDGRLIAIVGQQPVMRCTLVTRSGEHGFASVELFDTVAQRLQGFDEPSKFHF